jgi:hypothetical protein
MTMPNPYAHSRTEQEFAQPEYAQSSNRYAVPPEGDAPYIDALGWAPSLRLGPESVPDANRLGTLPLRQMRPDATQAPEEWYAPQDADAARRNSVQTVHGVPWDENQEYPGYPAASAGQHRFAPNPRGNPSPNSRVTQSLSPRTYSFWKPFGAGSQESARTFNGLHFSMADHRRNYDILGMAPVKSRRNTYRLDPGPWDANLVDMPPVNTTPVVMEVAQPVDVDYQSRSWRLS